MKDEMSDESRRVILEAIRKAAYFIAKANRKKHGKPHAMACLALWKAHKY
jgi:hypothetical protein